MKYTKFKIKNFMNIRNAEMKVDKKIIPIIGYNGSGKTNLLIAMNWFNSYDRDLGSKKITSFLSKDPHPLIEAEIECDDKDSFNVSKYKNIYSYIFENEITRKSENSNYIKLLEEIKNSKIENSKNKFTLVYDPRFLNNDINYYFKNTENDLKKIDDFFTNNNSNQILNEIYEEFIKKYNGIIFETLINLPYVKYFTTDEENLIIEGITEIDPSSFDSNGNWERTLSNLFKHFTKKSLLEICTMESFQVKEVENALNKGIKSEIDVDGLFDFLNGGSETKTDIEFQIHKMPSHSIVKIEVYILFTHISEETGQSVKTKVSFKDLSSGFKALMNFYLSMSYDSDEKNQIILLDEPTNFLSNKILKILWDKMNKDIKEKGFTYFFTTHNPFGISPKHMKFSDVMVVKQNEYGSSDLHNIEKLPFSEEMEKNLINKMLYNSFSDSFYFDLSQEKVNIIVEGISDFNVLNEFMKSDDFNFIIMDGFKKYRYTLNKCLTSGIECRFLIDSDGNEKKFFQDEVKKGKISNEILESNFTFINDINNDWKTIESVFDIDEFKIANSIQDTSVNIKGKLVSGKFNLDNAEQMPKTIKNLKQLYDELLKGANNE